MVEFGGVEDHDVELDVCFAEGLFQGLLCDCSGVCSCLVVGGGGRGVLEAEDVCPCFQVAFWRQTLVYLFRNISERMLLKVQKNEKMLIPLMVSHLRRWSLRWP